MDLALELSDSAPGIRTVNELEARSKAVADEITWLEDECSSQAALANIAEKPVRAILERSDFDSLPQRQGKELIRSLVEQMELNPVDLTFRIHYGIAVDSVCMASPRGVEPLLPP